MYALYRRRRRALNLFTPMWAAVFVLLFVGALVDHTFNKEWGLASELWTFLAFATAAPVFWIFTTLIHKANLAYIRHTYGPEPTD
ncbi:MAG: hypothetical protein NTX28_11620 [Novosphingobium sp.]|nr:hypothetical protein [Novosphingobium sp.]